MALPLQTFTVSDAPVAALTLGQPDSAGTVLLVDDNAIVRNSLARMLRRHAFNVIEASDGPSALEACRTRGPDLVLLDVQMPGVDGFEVCRTIRNDPASALVPIMLVTALDTAEYRLRGAEAGADDFFTKPVATPELVARVRNAMKQKTIINHMEPAESVLFTLARIVESRDADTEGHCTRLSQVAERLARRMGLPLSAQAALRTAGIVHDIGKVVVPDAVLLKRGPLNADEWSVMRRHAAEGERICAPLHSLRDVLPIIRHHHERLNGTGYPDGLRGAEIPITARVLQVVDVYDALSMSRPYKKALPKLEVLGIMQSEVQAGWWDPQVFEVFQAMILEEGRN